MKDRELFLAALEIEDPAARQAHLQAECAGDATLLARVEALLGSHESQSRFLNTPVVEQMADASDAGSAATILAGNESTQDDEPDASAEHSHRPAPMIEHHDDADDEIPLGYLDPSTKPDALGRLGHYEILEIVGRGAFGTVLRAFDEKLHRVVAIKVLAPEMAATSPARKRFLREARTSAAIRHENVVAIHAVEDEPIPYLVMDYIPGQTLQRRLDEHGPLNLPDVLRLGKQIADGLAAAHAQGLIHRDIKPGNILLDGGVTERVKITDFGLARTADDASVTQSGLIAGTPMYMAPEQAIGRKLDKRADLFSFGSVLYQMLSGRPPFRASNTIAVLKRVVDDPPRPIEEIIPEVPDWMCELIGHLHAKNPDDRYGSAREVSELLARCASDLQAGHVPKIPDPSKAKVGSADESPTAVAEPVGPRRSESHLYSPLVKIAAAVVIILGVLGFTEATGVTSFASTVIRLTTGSGTLVIETDDPDVKISVDGEEVTIRGGGVEELTLRPGEYKVAALRDGKAVKQELVSITRNGRSVVRMSLEGNAPVSPPGNRLAQPITRNSQSQPETPAASPAHDSTLPDVITLKGHPNSVYAVQFSPDGRLLASGGADSVRVWDARTGSLLHVLDVPKANYYALTFSPDSRYVMTAPSQDKLEAKISIWDVTTGRSAGVLDVLPSGIYELSFSPDGNTLMAGGRFPFIRLWDFTARRKLRDIGSLNPWNRSVVAGNRGIVALGGYTTTLIKSDGTVVKTSGRQGGPYCFSRDGRRLAGTTWKEGRVTIWDGETLDEIATWIAHTGRANGVAFSPDGQVLVTAGGDARVRLWDVETQRQLAELSHEAEAYAVSFSPDGQTLATTGFDKLVKLWNVPAILALRPKTTADSKSYQWPADAPPPAIAPVDAEQAKAHQEAWAKYLGVPVEKEIVLGPDKDGNDVAMSMVLIPPGEFLMGSTAEEQSIFLDMAKAAEDERAISGIPSEGPQRRVRVTKPFWLSRHEVTIGQFRRFAEAAKYKTEAERDGLGGKAIVDRNWKQSPEYVWHSDLGFPQTEDHPVSNVTWNDAAAYCEWLAQHCGCAITLPTEAQWEYACRAGTETYWHGGDSEADVEQFGWVGTNSRGSPHPVGLLKPNAFGLYDMHGNMWEWCADWFALDTYAKSSQDDPTGPSAGSERVLRGGSWITLTRRCRTAHRGHYSLGYRISYLGFRVAAALPENVLRAKLSKSPD